MNNRPLGIKAKLLIGFFTVIAIFITSSLIILKYLHTVESDTDKMVNVLIPSNTALVDLHSEITELQMYLQSYIVFHDQTVKSDLNKQSSLIEKISNDTDAVLKRNTDPDILNRWNDISKLLSIYLTKTTTTVTLADSGDFVKASEQYRREVLPTIRDLNNLFNTAISRNLTDVGLLHNLSNAISNQGTDIDQQLGFIYIALLISILIGFILSVIIATLTARSIINPIKYAIDISNEITAGRRDVNINTTTSDETGRLLSSLSLMLNSIKQSEDKINVIATDNRRLYDSVVKAANLFSQHASRVSSGDLTNRLDLEHEGINQDIMIKLGKDLNNMTDNLSNVTNEIMSACSSMVSTLEEVRHAVDTQSSGASEQASSINQITASVTEIEKSATQTMNKAKDLGGVAEKTRQSGQLGLESIESSVLGMKSVRDRVQLIAQTILELSRQTQQVGEITSVVNNLAQQSKMLALNASIEAAKAGDAGKGFAVVAAEVKNLAEQSEQSTSQVQKILEDIRIATEKAVMVTEEGTKGVDNGLIMIEKTGEVIRNLNDVIREASIVSQQIEAAVRQETAGIEQITAGMNEINIVTASFLESVNQTTEAMENLSTVSKKLKSRVETYKI